MTVDYVVEFFTALGKILASIAVPLVLIISVIIQVQEKWAAKRRGKDVQDAATKAQQAAGLAQEAATTAATKVEGVALKTEEVRQALAHTDEKTSGMLRDISIQTDKVHMLVNSNMGMQLKISAYFARRLADVTGKQEDKLAADEAERLFHVHEAQQAQVDTKTGLREECERM